MKDTAYIYELRQYVASAKEQGQKIAIVPTMGYLHKGHMSLVEAAKNKGDFVVLTIFVNPLQFGPNEDYEKYPRNLEKDLRLAEEGGVDVVFHPSVNEMYPESALSAVEIRELDSVLCGASRPGHFRGVVTVVSKLFNIVQPDRAYFGKKDFQQYLVIRRMVSDLNFPIEVIGVPIVREEDGLAMSSRNVYLTDEQRVEALVLNRSLMEAEKRINEGERNARFIEAMIKDKIQSQSSGEIDYVEVRSANNLAEIEKIEEPVLIALAVRFGLTRLIDNRVVEV